MSILPESIAYVDIFPPINIARVGDSDDYYLGPEVPGVEPVPPEGFKDPQHRIKKQAARFRVYAYDENSKLLGEITDDQEYALRWSVHVANKKAAWVKFRGRYQEEQWELRNPEVQEWPRDAQPNYQYTEQRTQLILDSKEKTISKDDQQPVLLQGAWTANNLDLKVTLGSLQTDKCGRLLFLASDGNSFYVGDPEDPHPDLESEMDNDNWVDSTCDGIVKVTVESRKSPKITIKLRHKATIITAPPKFTPGIQAATTLLDLVEDIYEDQRRGPGYDVGVVDYYRHIYPIFKRIYLISWTNLYATLGHGPLKADYFLDNPDLANPKGGPDAERVRKHIFERTRAPVREGDTQNEQLRDSQADSFFMPRLGGNDGDLPESTTDWKESEENPKKRILYASLTQLQHDRLAKWSRGQFETGKPEILYDSFDAIPLNEQPDALTRAALEWSVGAPLYPGIEVYWVAERKEMYNLCAKYRFAEAVRPGDLGRGLALPWQSDFFMCNTHWWPSIRPDNVVTEKFFADTTNHFRENPSIIALNLTERVRWDRGLERSGDPDDDFDIPGTSDMVRKWSKLGFITHESFASGNFSYPVYIEKERHPDLKDYA